MINNARGKHTSPGVYQSERVIPYPVKSLGITTLGVVGETLKGPAFEPIMIENWDAFQDYFGGTSAEKFKESGYPKYELPYIAQSYLKASKDLRVCRVLGLSGYNAGPAWVISAEGPTNGKGNNMVIAVIRSRGQFKKIAKVVDTETPDSTPECPNETYVYDKLIYTAKEVALKPYSNLNMMVNCNGVTGSTTEASFDVNVNNYGQFTLEVTTIDGEVLRYPVSLNPNTKEYILNVLGSKQNNGDTPIYVEELYDVALQQLIISGEIKSIKNTISKFDAINVEPIGAPVLDMLLIDEGGLTRGNVGQRFLSNTQTILNQIEYREFNEDGIPVLVEKDGEKVLADPKPAKLGYIYNVRSFNWNGKRIYCYGETVGHSECISNGTKEDTTIGTGQVFVINYDKYFMFNKDKTQVQPVVCDFNDYKEQFRSAVTPWFVSELKGDGKNVELNKLFRFHTISDGNAANGQVKISIENVKLDDGTFDVLVRDYNDSDGTPSILERYTKCSMKPGSVNYIGLRIGTIDGNYINKSKYVVLEVIESGATAYSVPCGFLGYPIRDFSGLQVNGVQDLSLKAPYVAYNDMYNNNLKDRRQYFGMSDLTGIDIDVFNYKGKAAYGTSLNAYTPCFHLDSTLDKANTEIAANISVDGEKGYKWITVSPNNVTREGKAPIISSEANMVGTIYENTLLRKFTAYPYGGFDGWDEYRGYRSNTDDFKATKYQAPINNLTGVGVNFGKINDGAMLGLSGETISSDYYAYLAGVRQFANPEAVKMHIFATPGIDYVNNNLLVEEVVDMVESERSDAIYIVTTPEKPFGTSDNVANIYSAQSIAMNAEDSGINSSYVATYYPWVKFFDEKNNVYINLPVTKDVVRNMAVLDNTLYPWYAPAGIDNGPVTCVEAHYKIKQEEEDTIYSSSVNPIKTFAVEGVKTWGNKTLYFEDTPVNRVNVRRLMLRMRAMVRDVSIRLVFQPNDATVVEQFKSLVNPILATIKSNRGITDAYLTVDNSVEARDRHELNAQIFVKPIGALEYVNIDFVITPEGVNFADVV